MALLSAAGMENAFPASIRKALAINPAPGSTFLDAEHVVILMQENRSFDHCFGTLQGVRGFNDPRVFRLANGNPVWYQTNAAGKTFAPFRLNIRDTKATWMGSLPHSRASQTDAYNRGQHDEWLNACAHRDKSYAHMPLTMGYYNREDLPFYYALADAFTIGDQHFCSALTSTWPNRHYLWSGTIRNEQVPASRARIRNDLAFGEATWRTFPELLESRGISWRVYQNDLTCGGGFERDERSWLTNYTCNPLEYFARHQVKFSDRYRETIRQQLVSLPKEIAELEEAYGKVGGDADKKQQLATAIAKKREVLAEAEQEAVRWTDERFNELSATERNLYEKAFTTNRKDPDFRKLTTIGFGDGTEEKQMTVPKGDVLSQIREDVSNGKLPTVSWLVAPERFSDHPSAPWYGAWYVSEVLDILTNNPEVWKKTIFILTYDENDGYFDHVPPFVAPEPGKPGSGRCSEGIDTAIEWIPLEQELAFGIDKKAARGGPIGLGFRVPLIVASPWSRGGRVNSQVFDHTSALRFLEVLLSHKTGKPIREDNISAWRRAVCGDLTSVFTAFRTDRDKPVDPLERNAFLKTIYDAQFRQEPDAYREITDEQLAGAGKSAGEFPGMPVQEPGVREACALPYELYADGNLSNDRSRLEVSLSAADRFFGNKAAGSPFSVYTPEEYRTGTDVSSYSRNRNWQYAVAAGSRLTDVWPLDDFAGKAYFLRIHGPNGFYREFRGSAQDPGVAISCHYETGKGDPGKPTGNVVLSFENSGPAAQSFSIADHIFPDKGVRRISVDAGKKEQITIGLEKSFQWYDLSVSSEGHPGFGKRYAGHVETGQESVTDPVMGKIV